MRKSLISSFLIMLLLAQHVKAQKEPLAILLTWTQDPTTTISVDWHTLKQKQDVLYYRERGVQEWKKQSSDTHSFPFSDRHVHRAAIDGLIPGTSYEIKFGAFDKIYYFRTMPESSALEPIKIAIGGDTMHEKDMLEKTNRQVLEYDPHFIIMGGDMAYENGAADAVERVYQWFEGCKNTLITKDNRIIPIVVGIGNHEVAGGYYSEERFNGSDQDREKYAPYFFSLFAFPGQPGYNVLDFGTYLSLFILDTDHVNPIAGKQTSWLESELKKREDVLNIIPVYHIPAYPSVRDFEGLRSRAVRKNWLPLFEEHRIRIAFENHDHAYKRTFPIRENRINENGIVFVGDGAWGVSVREVHNAEETWYLNKSVSQRHFILLTLQGNHQQLTVINEDGQIIDRYPELHNN